VLGSSLVSLASAMTSPATDVLVQSLRARVAFIAAQAECGIDRSALTDTQVGALLSTIASTPNITLAVATAVTQELNLSPWSATHKLKMAAALADAQVTPTTKGQARLNQTCNSLETFLTSNDWEFLSNTDLALQPKVEKLASRMVSLGMTCPTEKLLMRGGALLHVAALNAAPLDPTSKQNLCIKLKESIKTLDKAKKFPYQHIIIYPAEPKFLPSAVFDFAYGAEQPVAPPPLGSFDEHVAHMCYRNTHKDLRTSSSVGPMNVKGGDNMTQMMQFCNMMQQMSRMCNSGGIAVGTGSSSSTGENPLNAFKPRSRQALCDDYGAAQAPRNCSTAHTTIDIKIRELVTVCTYRLYMSRRHAPSPRVSARTSHQIGACRV
jgi:hypothetical protein